MSLFLFGPGGCFLFQGNPSKANNDLRKQVQTLQGEVNGLKQQHEADQRALAAWQQRTPSQPTLPPDRLARLFTVHGLTFGRLTGGARLNPPAGKEPLKAGDHDPSGDDGIKVYVSPTDDTGEPFKAAGSFVVEAVDLAGAKPDEVGRWTFDLGQSRNLWGGTFLQRSYVLPCPWQKPPAHADLAVRVQFTDALTGATFAAQREVKVQLPPRAGPAPATNGG